MEIALRSPTSNIDQIQSKIGPISLFGLCFLKMFSYYSPWVHQRASIRQSLASQLSYQNLRDRGDVRGIDSIEDLAAACSGEYVCHKIDPKSVVN